jgi:hypothetical protein
VSSEGPTRLTREIAPWFEAAFRQRAMHERVTWDIVFGAAQTPQGLLPQLMVFASLPAATIGQVHAVFFQMPALKVTEEQVDRAVAGLLEQLFQMRTEALSQIKAPDNGQGRPPGPAAGKLVIPGA